MKNNYSAWNIDVAAFFTLPSVEDKYKFLVGLATLAPSTHNSQPWKFQIDQRGITIRPDFKRVLPVSDPNNRHLFISLGCALENLLIAADYYGFQPSVGYSLSGNEASIRVELPQSKDTNGPEKHLVFSIPKRRTNRLKYNDRLPHEQLLSDLKQLSTDDVLVSVITDTSVKASIVKILMESRIKAFSNKAFRGEMADYKRTNFTSSYFGMPGFTMDFGNLFSLISGLFIRHFNVMKVLRKRETELLESAPVYIFISSKKHDPEGWLATGRVMERVLLKAESEGVQTSISAVPLDVTLIQKVINTGFRPQMFIRLGYADRIPGHSPRLLPAMTIES